MHDSEQEHSGITGCRVTYESTIFYNEANKFSIIVVKTNDPRIPLQACNGRYYGDRMLRFTAVGYELPRTKAVELELDGEWVESKYGYQLQVEQWQEIVPQTADGLLAYLGSGLIKGIGPKTAEDIVATFGPDTLNILDNEPEKLLQIRGITEGKLKDIEESYAESRVLRNLMSLLGPFKITPATALKIYQHFGPACVDILKKCPYDLCQISGFGFKRVDGIVRKTDNRLHSTERIKGAVLYTLEDARSKSGHLFLPSEDLVKETLLLLNAPIPIPEQRVRTEEVQETLQKMILHGAVVAYKQYLYSPRVFGQEDDTARMIAERLANISVAENIESALESVRESLGITLSQKQEQAVRTAFQHGLTIITGSPGTGKTTVLKAIIEVFKNLHPKGKFALMAPTGRASRRMAESTGVDEARTLHSALGLGTGEEVGDGERVRFVDADLVIVDEFSMVDMWLAQQFFKRIGQHTRVVLVGDPNQLPSVGAGNVFYELIHSGMVPVTVLDWIFRQSKDGLIAYNAKFINEGSTKLYYGNDFVFVDSPTQIETARRIQDIYCKEAAERGIENVQILSPFREKGEAASEQLILRLGDFQGVQYESKGKDETVFCLFATSAIIFALSRSNDKWKINESNMYRPTATNILPEDIRQKYDPYTLTGRHSHSSALQFKLIKDGAFAPTVIFYSQEKALGYVRGKNLLITRIEYEPKAIRLCYRDAGAEGYTLRRVESRDINKIYEFVKGSHDEFREKVSWRGRNIEDMTLNGLKKEVWTGYAYFYSNGKPAAYVDYKLRVDSDIEMGVALTDKTSRKKSLSTGLINYCRLMFMSQRLFTGTYEENIAMRKTLENCGFTINYFYDKGSKVYTGFVRERIDKTDPQNMLKLTNSVYYYANSLLFGVRCAAEKSNNK